MVDEFRVRADDERAKPRITEEAKALHEIARQRFDEGVPATSTIQKAIRKTRKADHLYPRKGRN